METSTAQRLKALEEENRKLKKLLAEQVTEGVTNVLQTRSNDAQQHATYKRLAHRKVSCGCSGEEAGVSSRVTPLLSQRLGTTMQHLVMRLLLLLVVLLLVVLVVSW